MIDNSVFFRWHRLAVQGYVDRILCIEDDIAYPTFDFDLEKVVFVCSFCDFRVIPGLNMYYQMQKEVSEKSHLLNEDDDYDE